MLEAAAGLCSIQGPEISRTYLFSSLALCDGNLVKSDRLAAGVSVCHLFVRLRELLCSAPKMHFHLVILPEVMERLPFPSHGEVRRVKVAQSPLCYLLGIVLDQDVYSGIFILRNDFNEGKEFYWKLFNTLKLCC